VTPHLVRAVLALVCPDPDGLTHLALDSVRCGRWEVFTLGVVWHGRALVVGWAVLPHPWPKGQFTPTVCALVRQVAAAWPSARPVHLVAHRGFPSHRLFLVLRQVRWGWTLRLRARTAVTVGGRVQNVRALLGTARPESWTVHRATYGRELREPRRPAPPAPSTAAPASQPARPPAAVPGRRSAGPGAGGRC
jgi:hypothetical protein